MSVLILETQLEENKPYTINKVSHLQADVLKLIGLKAIFKAVNGSTASVQVTGRMKSVPVRSLVTVKGYEFKAVSPKNADGFVVIAKNNFGFKVGTAFLKPTIIDKEFAHFTVEGKSVRLPLDILTALVKKKEKAVKAATKEIKKASKDSGIPHEVIQEISDATNLSDCTTVPPFLLKLLPNVYVEEIAEILKEQPGTYSDFNGEIHETIAEASKANVVIKHKMLEEKFLQMLEIHTRRHFETIRKEEGM